LLFRGPPAFEKVVLDRGDQWAAHAGGSGGLRIAAPDVASPAPDAAFPQSAGLRASDRDWLAAQGITWESEDTSR
jgi:hypothetical protein